MRSPARAPRPRQAALGLALALALGASAAGQDAATADAAAAEEAQVDEAIAELFEQAVDEAADEAVQELFQDQAAPAADATAQAAAQAPAASPSVLEEAQKREVLSYSYSISAVGGTFFGWTSLDYLSDPWEKLGHTTGAIMTASLSADLRPNDWFRLHYAGRFYFPTNVSGVMGFGYATKEIFFDYLLGDSLSNRFGKYAVTWGNARLLGVANLPGRTVDEDELDEEETLAPGWAATPTPSIWFKSALPLGRLTLTGLVGLPSDPAAMYFSLAGFGATAEYVFGSTCLTLAGYMKDGYTSRAAAMLKTSVAGVDCFLDSALAFPEGEDPRLSADLGCYYRTKRDPDLTFIAELRWNDEAVPAGGTRFADGLTIGGLTSGAAATWSGMGGSRADAFLEWFHCWSDGSGAVVAALSYDFGRGLSAQLAWPFVYGDEGSGYIEHPPSEAKGYATGLGLALKLKISK